MRRSGIVFFLLAVGAAGVAAQESRRAAFDSPVTVIPRSGGSMVCLLDLDGDGDRDVITQRQDSFSSMRFNCLPNLGDGRFGAEVFAATLGYGLSPVPPGFVAVAAAGRLETDDGRDDAVFAFGGTMTWMTSSPGGPVSGGFFPFSGAARGVRIVDFDQDGRGDIVALTSDALFFLRSLGNGIFLPYSVAVSVGATAASPVDLLVAEMTGDARLDAVVVDVSGVKVFTFNGTSFGAPVVFPHGLPDPMPVVGDIDGDLDLDLVVFGMTSYVVFRRTAPATFVAEALRTGGPATQLFDVDGDGDLDGACCSSGGGFNDPVVDQASIFRVSLNQGGGIFAPAFEMPGVGTYHLAGYADMDGDGHGDLVAGRCIYFGHGPIAAPPTLPSPAPSSPASRHFDLDQDGDVDLDVGLGGGGVFWNDGRGFGARAQPVAINAPSGVTYVGPGYPIDWDGDGDRDLIVEAVAGPTFMGMRKLENRGGAFVDAGIAFPLAIRFSQYIGTDPKHVLARDFDGDGRIDLATRFLGQPSWSHLWFNDGGGVFTTATVIAGVVVMDAADFTRDGIPDLLVSAGNLRLSRGLGNRSFAPPEALASAGPLSGFDVGTAISPLADDVAIGDFDEDGDPDIVAVSRALNRAVMLLRNGSPAGAPLFVDVNAPGGISTVSNQPQSIRLQASDVDGDGHLDVLVGDPTDVLFGSVGVMRGDPASPTAFDPSLVAIHPLPGFTAAVDLDGDGDPDAIGTATVLRGRAFVGAAAGGCHQFAPGVAGAGGIVPTLGALGPFRAGRAASAVVRGGLGAAPALLALGVQPDAASIFGTTLYLVPLSLLPLTLDGAPGAEGAGSASIPFGIIPPSLAGATVYFQAAIADPAGLLGLSHTNPLRVTIGS